MVGTAAVTASASYTLEQAEEDIATLRGLVDTMNEAHSILDGGVVPNITPSSGVTLFSQGGDLHYEGFDGNEYSTGRATFLLTGSSQTISSTSPVVINNMTTPVGAGSYHFRALVMYQGNGTGTTASTPAFRITCPAFTTGGYGMVAATNGPLVSVRYDNTSGGGVDLLAPQIPSNATTLRYNAVIEGSATFTATGTLSVTARLSGLVSDFQYVIAGGSVLSVFPVD
jgi:hypothetical protein